jgi:hypothetical protein
MIGNAIGAALLLLLDGKKRPVRQRSGMTLESSDWEGEGGAANHP